MDTHFAGDKYPTVYDPTVKLPERHFLWVHSIVRSVPNKYYLAWREYFDVLHVQLSFCDWCIPCMLCMLQPEGMPCKQHAFNVYSVSSGWMFPLFAQG